MQLEYGARWKLAGMNICFLDGQQVHPLITLLVINFLPGSNSIFLKHRHTRGHEVPGTPHLLLLSLMGNRGGDKANLHPEADFLKFPLLEWNNFSPDCLVKLCIL